MSANDPTPTKRPEPRRYTWNPAPLEELRALQEPGEPDPVSEFIELYGEQAPPLLEKLRRFAAQRDAVQLREVAHRLKGSALNLGAEKLARAASLLEQACVRGELASLEPLAADVEVEHARFAAKTSGR